MSASNLYNSILSLLSDDLTISIEILQKALRHFRHKAFSKSYVYSFCSPSVGAACSSGAGGSAEATAAAASAARASAFFFFAKKLILSIFSFSISQAPFLKLFRRR